MRHGDVQLPIAMDPTLGSSMSLRMWKSDVSVPSYALVGVKPERFEDHSRQPDIDLTFRCRDQANVLKQISKLSVEWLDFLKVEEISGTLKDTFEACKSIRELQLVGNAQLALTPTVAHISLLPRVHSLTLVQLARFQPLR